MYYYLAATNTEPIFFEKKKNFKKCLRLELKVLESFKKELTDFDLKIGIVSSIDRDKILLKNK